MEDHFHFEFKEWLGAKNVCPVPVLQILYASSSCTQQAKFYLNSKMIKTWIESIADVANSKRQQQLDEI